MYRVQGMLGKYIKFNNNIYIVKESNNNSSNSISLCNRSTNKFLRHTAGRIVESPYPEKGKDKYFYDDSSFIPVKTSVNYCKLRCSNKNFEKYYLSSNDGKYQNVISSKIYDDFYIYNLPKVGEKVVVCDEQFIVVNAFNNLDDCLSFKSIKDDLYLSYNTERNIIEKKCIDLNYTDNYSFIIEFDNEITYIVPTNALSNSKVSREIIYNDYVVSDYIYRSMINDLLVNTTNLLKNINDRVEFLEKKIDRLESIYVSNNPITSVPKAVGLLRRFQLNGTNLLVTFDRICRNSNIEYWLRAGTLLGAYRNKGFIPWDDDLDIGMTYENFKKFRIVIDNLKTLIDFYEFEPYSYKIFMKGKQSWIDIFVFYFKPQDVDLNTHKSLHEKIKRESSLKLAEFGVSDVYRKFVIQKTIEISSENQSDYLFMGIENYEKIYYCLQTDYVYPLKELEFEGHSFFVPNKTLDILLKNYGDIFNYPKTLKSNHVITKW